MLPGPRAEDFGLDVRLVLPEHRTGSSSATVLGARTVETQIVVGAQVCVVTFVSAGDRSGR